MALSNKELTSYGVLGAVAGVATGFVLSTISSLVSMIPGVSLNLQSISISTTGVGNVVNTGLSTYAQKLLGLVPISLSGMEWVYAAIGGALFMVLGAYIVDALKMMTGTKVARLTKVMVAAGIITGAILSWSISIPTISAFIIMIVDALILSVILVWLDDALGLKLVP